ncbi:hypothetical protein PAHAL_6G194300 [Panicum hallii]|jgi:hypothetical protein|uniref:Uncharacterized protein n=1 Tax=Panicum hallii TaxID=206008 RepID=A0A2T8IGW4_9POAL|nr:hypothetical protein PAHAL_6G194300 [Panicum hallii]
MIPFPILRLARGKPYPISREPLDGSGLRLARGELQVRQRGTERPAWRRPTRGEGGGATAYGLRRTSNATTEVPLSSGAGGVWISLVAPVSRSPFFFPFFVFLPAARRCCSRSDARAASRGARCYAAACRGGCFNELLRLAARIWIPAVLYPFDNLASFFSSYFAYHDHG